MSGIRKTKWLAGLIAAAVVASGLSGCSSSPASNEAAMPASAAGASSTPPGIELTERSDEPVLAAENGYLQLFVNAKTADVFVTDKRTGISWHSNPPDRDKDTVVNSANLAELSSQLMLTYSNDQGHLSTITTFTDSVQKNQHKIYKTERGVQVVYQIGSFESAIDAIPKVIGKERFETLILNKIADASKRNKIRVRFFFNEKEQVYERKKLQDYMVKEIVALLESVGYTAKDAAEDNAKVKGGQTNSAASPRFVVPLVYELDEDNLVVSVKAGEIKETPEFPLYDIRLLGFFGAAGVQSQGYIFVPDGSGALIQLNRTKKGVPMYELPVYGKDQTPLPENVIPQFEQTTRLPVFGMKQDRDALFAIIEQGEAQATILADTSGKLNSYNYVGASFRLRQMEMFQFHAGSVSKQAPKYSRLYNGTLQIRYAFLAGQSADYVGMAKYYQHYLVQHGQLRKLEANEPAPFVLELVGSVPVRKTFAGIPYPSVTSVTSFDQAIEILQLLADRGVKRVQLRYSGWFNKGIFHKQADSVSVDGVLGGRKGFDKLLAYAKSHGVEVYPDVALLRIYRNGSSFLSKKDTASFLERRGAQSLEDDVVTTNPDRRLYYILAPRKLTELVRSFMDSYREYAVGGLSLRDLANDLNTDITSGATYHRQNVEELAISAMKEIAAQMGRVMVDGGNAYSFPYARSIVNAPLGSTGLLAEDESVPFYAIVLHGFIDYAGIPMNQAENQNARRQMLKSLEAGANIYYQWFYEKAYAVRETKLNTLFSANYTDWMEEAVSLYAESEAFRRSVRGQSIVGHRKLAEGVYETTYEKGQSVIVNYGPTAVTLNGIQIEPESFRIGGVAS